MNSDFALPALAPEFLWTIVIVSVVILANIAISAILRGRSWLSRETKLRGSVFWRNFSFLIALIGLVFTWRSELRAAALSLAALSVALVLAGKELLTSAFGYIHLTTSGSFSFGDVIEINNIKGEVIDQSLLSTTVLEMSEEHLFTGRVIQFPNSFFVMHAMKNFSRLGRYQLGLVSIPVGNDSDLEAARRILIEVANSVCSDYVAPTHAALRELEGEQFIVMPSAEPRVSIRLGEGGKTTLLLRFPCPASERTRTEQEVLSKYLAGMRGAGQRTEDAGQNTG
ncbi:MAG: mechanosensitive ion channel domain-containing protein [Betaproteobacteria bacterium]